MKRKRLKKATTSLRSTAHNNECHNQWPCTVKTPEGPIIAQWIHKKTVRLEKRDEVHIRLVLDKETFVIRCLPHGWIKKKNEKPLIEEIEIPDENGNIRKYISSRPAGQTMFVKDYNPELNPPLEINAPILSIHDGIADLIHHLTKLANPANSTMNTPTPYGKTLLAGNLLMQCLGYCHDTRSAEEIEFVRHQALTPNSPDTTAAAHLTTPREHDIRKVVKQAATEAAEETLSRVNPALRCSKLNPDRGKNEDLHQAFTLERRNQATDQATFEALARMDISMARKDGIGIWMRHSVAVKHNQSATKGESISENDVKKRAAALKKQYCRVLTAARSPRD